MRKIPTPLLMAVLSTVLITTFAAAQAPPPAPPTPSKPTAIELLKSENWETISFGGEGPVEWQGGTCTLEFGTPLTGVRLTSDLDQQLTRLGADRNNYQLDIEARRLEGTDFFCAFTFPVGSDGHLTFVCGGWGGSLVGLSSLDGSDASENPTSCYHKFDKERWYRLRIRVTPKSIECWIDQNKKVSILRSDFKRFHLRPEVIATRPLGVCSFRTRAEYRSIKLSAVARRVFY